MSRSSLCLFAAAVPFFASTAEAACEVASTVSQLQEELDSAEQAYSSFDIEVFRGSLDNAAELLPCLAVVAPTSTIAHYHRMQGLLASVVRDQDRARQAFLAARSIDPGYRFPTDMLSEDHPIRLDYAAMPLDGVVWLEMPEPREGSLLVDGQKSTSIPTTRPAIVQRTDAMGQIAETTYLWPGETFDYEARKSGGGSSTGPKLLAVAGGLGAGAAVLTALAAGSSQTYWNDTTLDNYEAQRSRTNTLNTLAITTGAAASAVGVGALLTWDW